MVCRRLFLAHISFPFATSSASRIPLVALITLWDSGNITLDEGGSNSSSFYLHVDESLVPRWERGSLGHRCQQLGQVGLSLESGTHCCLFRAGRKDFVAPLCWRMTFVVEDEVA